MTRFKGLATGSLLAALALVVPNAVQAQGYPEREIRFIVPFGAGGSTDIVAREFARKLEEVLDADLNVENKPGGSGTIGAGMIMQAPADGYTIGLVPSEVLTYQPLVHSDLAYRSVDDYLPIAKLGNRPSVLFVRADAPWETFDEFIADAKSNPGKLRASVPGVGTLSDLVVRQLNKVADVQIDTVPFTGGGSEAMVALLGGRVDAFIGSVSGNLGQLQAGQLRALAAFQKGKNEAVPKATSVIDAGYNVTLQVAFYVIAPKDLPAAIRDKLAEASLEVLQSQEFADFAKKNDLILDAMGPEEAKKALVDLTRDFEELIAANAG